jgi:hypothetical protein
VTTFGAGLFGDGTFGEAEVPGWRPGDAWPSGTPGGAASPHWGGYVKVWIRAGLAAGNTFHIGTHEYARLDDGNVVSGAPAVAARVVEEFPRLWVDLSCDVMDCEIAGGASSGAGILSTPDTATLKVKLSDPDGIYDPLSTTSPYAYMGRSRLMPGTPVEAFAEVVDGDTGEWTRHWLFTGTADSWGEDWTADAADRTCTLIASDVTKQWVRYNYPEQDPAGAGDTTGERVERLADFYGWTGTIEPAPTSTVTLQATTLAQSGWELLQRTLDDELGYVHFTADGHLRWLERAAWNRITSPVLEVGCPSIDPDLRDVLIDADPSARDYEMVNQVSAARTGGTAQTARSETSIVQYGEHDYSRTDLGLETDLQASEWATFLLSASAFPQVRLEKATIRPAYDTRSWEIYRPIFDLRYVTDLVRIGWAPPGRPEDVIDGRLRVLGHAHTITYDDWEIAWTLTAAIPFELAGTAFTIGPHAQDQLDAGYVLA